MMFILQSFQGKTKNIHIMSEERMAKQYKKISREDRYTLLSLIVEKKHTIKKAAQILGIGASTARMILKKYQITGEVFESKADRRTRVIIEKIQKEKAHLPNPVQQPKSEDNSPAPQVLPYFYICYPVQNFFHPQFF